MAPSPEEEPYLPLNRTPALARLSWLPGTFLQQLPQRISKKKLWDQQDRNRAAQHLIPFAPTTPAMNDTYPRKKEAAKAEFAIW